MTQVDKATARIMKHASNFINKLPANPKPVKAFFRRNGKFMMYDGIKKEISEVTAGGEKK